MKVYDLADFQKFGFRSVTAETDGLGMRVLYGVNEKAWEIVKEFFGLAMNTPPHPFLTSDYSSLLIPPSLVLTLLVFCIFYEEEPLRCIAVREQSVPGFSVNAYVKSFKDNEDNEWQETLKSLDRMGIRYTSYYRGGDALYGTRNRHFFTGLVR